MMHREILLAIILVVLFIAIYFGIRYAETMTTLGKRFPQCEIRAEPIVEDFEKKVRFSIRCDRKIDAVIYIEGVPVTNLTITRPTDIVVDFNWKPSTTYNIEVWSEGARVARTTMKTPKPIETVSVKELKVIPAIVAGTNRKTFAVYLELCTRDVYRAYLLGNLVPGITEIRWSRYSIYIPTEIKTKMSPRVYRYLTEYIPAMAMLKPTVKVDTDTVIVDIYSHRTTLYKIYDYVMSGAVYIYVGKEFGRYTTVHGKIEENPYPMPYRQIFETVTVYNTVENCSLRIGTSTIVWECPKIVPYKPILIKHLGRGYIVWIPTTNCTDPEVALLLLRVVMYRYWLSNIGGTTFVDVMNVTDGCHEYVEIPLKKVEEGLYTLVLMVATDTRGYYINKFVINIS